MYCPGAAPWVNRETAEALKVRNRNKRVVSVGKLAQVTFYFALSALPYLKNFPGAVPQAITFRAVGAAS
jgi:hypothetical protein